MILHVFNFSSMRSSKLVSYLKKKRIAGPEANIMIHYRGWGAVLVANVFLDFLLLLPLLLGKESPPGSDTPDDADESMPVPEDLSASTGGQQNSRNERMLGKSADTSSSSTAMHS